MGPFVISNIIGPKSPEWQPLKEAQASSHPEPSNMVPHLTGCHEHFTYRSISGTTSPLADVVHINSSRMPLCTLCHQQACSQTRLALEALEALKVHFDTLRGCTGSQRQFYLLKRGTGSSSTHGAPRRNDATASQPASITPATRAR